MNTELSQSSDPAGADAAPESTKAPGSRRRRGGNSQASDGSLVYLLASDQLGKDGIPQFSHRFTSVEDAIMARVGTSQELYSLQKLEVVTEKKAGVVSMSARPAGKASTE